jgi:hypothetical protein
VTRPRIWTDEQFRAAAAASRSQREMIGRLGLSSPGSGHTTLHRNAPRLQVTLPQGKPTAGRPRSWTDDDLRRVLAADPPSMRAVTAGLRIQPSGNNNKTIRRRARELDLELPVWRRP